MHTRRFIFLLICCSSLLAQSTQAWNGYVQVRYSDNFSSTHSFEVRRAKLWLSRQTPFANKFHYKIQGKFSFKKHGDFILQDVFAEYRFKNGWVRLGQQKPDFSLERSQPDYLIPVAERALVVDALIPAAESGARDIGIQVHGKSSNKLWSGSVGCFNGEGGNRSGNADHHFLFTSRQRLHFALPGKTHLNLGVSGSYRNIRNTVFTKIFSADHLFSGRDFRGGAEVVLAGLNWALQGEFIEAQLEKQRSFGWYLLGEYRFSSRNLFGMQAEYFKDLNLSTQNGPAYNVSYSRLIKEQQAKITADLRMEPEGRSGHFSFIMQSQLFFN